MSHGWETCSICNLQYHESENVNWCCPKCAILQEKKMKTTAQDIINANNRRKKEISEKLIDQWVERTLVPTFCNRPFAKVVTIEISDSELLNCISQLRQELVERGFTCVVQHSPRNETYVEVRLPDEE